MEEIKKIWAENPGKAELFIHENSINAAEFAEYSSFLKELEESTNTFAFNGEYGCRVLGEGLVHSLQETEEIITVSSVFGDMIGTPKEISQKIENILADPWLKQLFGSNKISSEFNFVREFKVQLKNKLNDLPANFCMHAPEYTLKYIVEFLWGALVGEENIGIITECYIHPFNGVVHVHTSKSALFVGHKGETVNKISQIIGKEITVLSSEDPE